VDRGAAGEPRATGGAPVAAARPGGSGSALPCFEIQCSIARGAGDELSDLDVGYLLANDGFEETAAELPARVAVLGPTVDHGSPRRSARLACAPPRLGSPAGSPRPVWRAAIRSNRNSPQSTPSTTSSAHKDAGAERHRSCDDGLAVHDQPASSRALTSGPAGEAHAARGQNRRRSSPRGRFARRAERARRLFRPAETSDDLLPLQPPWFHGRHLAGLHPVLVLSAPSLTGRVPYRARGPNAADRNRIRDQGKGCSESESSINGSIPTAYWSSCKPMPEKKRRFPALLQSPLPDSNRRPPPYHGGFALRGRD
jgi:hypothetical protein